MSSAPCDRPDKEEATGSSPVSPTRACEGRRLIGSRGLCNRGGIMAKDGWTEGTDNSAETSGDLVDEPSAVQLVYRPQPADTRVGLRVRDRVKRTKLVLRG